MSFSPTNRAFQFSFEGTTFAIDIQTDGIVYFQPAVHLFRREASGQWLRIHSQMEPPLYITQQTVTEAGGIDAMCLKIIDKINLALRRFFGRGDTQLPPPANIQQEVLDKLRSTIEMYISADNVPQVRLKSG